jgi:hypothetical protein
MCGDIMEEVTGDRHPAEPGVLKGFRRCVVRGELYPGIIPQEGFEVPGIVYRNLSPDAWRRLDAFEGALYERKDLEIVLPDGGSLRAGTYVVKPEFASRLAPVDWNFEAFLENGKALFRRSYGGYGGIG